MKKMALISVFSLLMLFSGFRPSSSEIHLLQPETTIPGLYNNKDKGQFFSPWIKNAQVFTGTGNGQCEPQARKPVAV
ncbi:hypothetical protein [Dankookia sp. P2]|uniref:hypothetical protein n=1 Tax=Dankookia sp. P2 TaxID=3423955 RepID=UPI003D6768D8